MSVLAACGVHGTFPCQTDSQCVRDGMQGVCQIATKFCSFADPTCGQRYDETAGPFANQCVTNDAGIDAPLDAPGAPLGTRINVGGSQVIGFDFPGTWAADSPVTPVCTGTHYSVSAAINNTVDDALFQTGVYTTGGAINCTIANVVPGTYTVGLLFAEARCPADGFDFSVTIEGAAMGGISMATDGGGCATGTNPGKPFKKTYSSLMITDTALDVSLSVGLHGAEIAAIELVPG